MLIYAGIDEAGYGPLLGPLCVACTAFVVERAQPAEGAPNLWRTLNSAVCRKRSDRKRRIAVDDSKNLKLAAKGPKSAGAAAAASNGSAPPHPLLHLERGVLSFLRCAGCSEDGSPPAAGPATDDDLLRALDVDRAAEAWYDGPPTALPLGQTPAQLTIAAGRLRRAMQREAVRCELLAAEAVDAARFNATLARSGSKATVNFEAAMRLVNRVWQRWPAEHPRIIIDRHGGRTHYRQHLQYAFPDAHIAIIAESEDISRYRLERDGSFITVTFLTGGDAKHLPVALASMTAKFVRELFMLRMNRYFRSHLPHLKPTAGYVQDGRRYLAEIETLVRSMGVPRERLVRQA